MPVVTTLFAGRADGIAPATGSTARVPSLALLGVGNVLAFLLGLLPWR